MPSYKLTYFDLSGLAEQTRMLFHYGNIPFVDNRVKREDWPALKPKMPYGVMPVLEVDGKVLHQSNAIARYVANLVNLVGKDALENAQIDSTVDTLNDVRMKLAQYKFYEKDETRRAELKKTLDAETLPFFLSRLDAQAKANNGYLALGRLTWADVVLSAFYNVFLWMAEKDLFAQYPNLQKVHQNVLAIPQIKSYVDNRPEDKFP